MVPLDHSASNNKLLLALNTYHKFIKTCRKRSVELKLADCDQCLVVRGMIIISSRQFDITF